MKRLESWYKNTIELEVFECDCGFHVGIDGSWLDQCEEEAKEWEFLCPSCGRFIPVNELTEKGE